MYDIQTKSVRSTGSNGRLGINDWNKQKRYLFLTFVKMKRNYYFCKN